MKINKKLSFSALVFVFGFIGSFLGKNFEKTKLGQAFEKKLGIKTKEVKTTVTQTRDCAKQQEKDNSALFVGCSGFF